MQKKTIAFVLAFAGTLLLDQVTKLWVWSQVAYRTEVIQVIPGFFSIVHAQNPGAAFGMMTDNPYRHWVFLGFTVFALVVLLDLYRRLAPGDRFLAGTLGLLAAGAAGNAIDRMHKGTVTDFLVLYTDHPTLSAWLPSWFPNPWPTFNVADSALVVGVALFLVHTVFLQDGTSDAELEELAEEEARREHVEGLQSEDGSLVGPNEEPDEGVSRH